MEIEKKRLLIVDDYTLIRSAWKALINAGLSYEVVNEAKNGAMAVELCKKEAFDIILMDISMPVMDGIEATHQISLAQKNRPMGERSKIIGLSMHSEIEYVRKMILAGAVGYLTKDCSAPELFKALDTVSKGEKYITNQLDISADLAKEIFGK
jgi:DNA-binding NarL/FixJ family response regulator